jgi:hypothetical protein
MSVAARERLCPHCEAPNPIGLGSKCVKCRKRMGPYCFACFAPIGEDDASCRACGRGHWVVGDFAQIPCAVENGTVREHRYMTAVGKGERLSNEWRCLKCLTDQTRTDAFAHFPDRATL